MCLYKKNSKTALLKENTIIIAGKIATTVIKSGNISSGSTFTSLSTYEFSKISFLVS